MSVPFIASVRVTTRRVAFWTCWLVSIIAILVSLPAAAFTINDFNCAVQGDLGGTCFYEPCSTGASQTDTQGTGITAGPIYIMGDSITALASSSYQAVLSGAGWSPTIQGLVSRQIEGGVSPDGLTQIKNDQHTIGLAKAVVIALGTNGVTNAPSTTETQVKKAMQELGKYDTQGAPIFWVNVLDTHNDAASQATNKAIQNGVGDKGTVIDWYSTAKKSADLASFNGGVHPTKPQDIDLLTHLVYNTLSGYKSSGGNGTQGNGSLNYTTAGNLPAGGKDVGASEFTDSQGYMSDSLTGTYAYAELSPPGVSQSQVNKNTATAMGGLPYKQKLAITYKGKTVVAEKLDIGQGGGPVNGKPRDIDLIYDKTAQALGITDPNTWTGDVHVEAVADSTPLGPTNASAGTTAPTDNTGTTSCCGSSDSSSGTATPAGGSNNAQTAFDYLVTQGKLTPIAAAAMVGNFQQESGANLDTHADNGSHIGIAQWDSGGRWAGLLKHESGKDPYALTTQLDYVLYELNGSYKSSTLDPINKDNNLDDATNIVFTYYEAPGDSTLPARQANAKKILQDYGGSVSSVGTGSTADCSSSSSPSGTKPNFIDLSGGASASLGHGKLTNINALVIHYTEGNQEGAALRDFFINSTPGYGVQFNIGLTGKVYNYFPLDNMQEAWHVGDINSHSIGIEITGMDGQALLNNQTQFNTVVNTVQYLCSYYHIPCSSPKGDITGDHNDPSKAQGLLGHDEAPNPVCGGECDHSDPDTKIVNGTEYDITTGKVWTNADRKNSSIHAYMMKLRQALGYNPTPG